MTEPMISSVCIKTNAELFSSALELYANDGDTILDMTYGNGVFWKLVRKEKYDCIFNDMYNPKASLRSDFRTLTEIGNESIDIAVLDPPYLRTSNRAGIMANECHNQTINLRTHGDVLNLYLGGIASAKRVLKPEGLLMIKCQDETEGSIQKWTHIEYCLLLS